MLRARQQFPTFQPPDTAIHVTPSSSSEVEQCSALQCWDAHTWRCCRKASVSMCVVSVHGGCFLWTCAVALAGAYAAGCAREFRACRLASRCRTNSGIGHTVIHAVMAHRGCTERPKFPKLPAKTRQGETLHLRRPRGTPLPEVGLDHEGAVLRRRRTCALASRDTSRRREI